MNHRAVVSCGLNVPEKEIHVPVGCMSAAVHSRGIFVVFCHPTRQWSGSRQTYPL